MRFSYLLLWQELLVLLDGRQAGRHIFSSNHYSPSRNEPECESSHQGFVVGDFVASIVQYRILSMNSTNPYIYYDYS